MYNTSPNGRLTATYHLSKAEADVRQLDFLVRILVVGDDFQNDEQLVGWEILLRDAHNHLGHFHRFALFGLQERSTLFVTPGDETYGGMIVGENVRTDDMDVNVSKEKKLTNMRTTASDENIKLEPPRKITLELALEFIQDDELIEVTPDAIRLRKRILDANQRKKAAKKANQPV